jgi:hypothetical protein
MMRGCAQYSHSTCSLMNAMLCPLNSKNMCKCGICSTEKCNDDSLKLTSDGTGQNVTSLMKNFTNNLTTAKTIDTTIQTIPIQIITTELTTAKNIIIVKTNPVTSFSAKLNANYFLQKIIIVLSFLIVL